MGDRKQISHELLLQLLHYDPETGLFRWAMARPKVRIGQIAGSRSHHRGYVLIEVLGDCYLAHRLAWFYMTREWPSDQIDHVNMDRADNRFCNIRQATNGQNHMNQGHSNKNGFKGIAHHPWLKDKPFEARINKGGKQKTLGCYATAEEAHEAYKKAAIELHGEFARF